VNILVTGGLGVVGRPLVLRLLSHGHVVRVLDRKLEDVIDGAECVAGDITDFAQVREHMRGMQAVIHLAALTYPAAGPGQEIFRINCAGSYNIYEAAAQEGIRRVVSASSINALGFNFGVKSFPIQYLPIDEDHPTYTSDAYSFSKQTLEEIAAYYWRRDGISGVQFRLPGVYPWQWSFGEQFRQMIQQSRQTVGEFAQMPEAEQRARASRIIAGREHERANRLMEKPWDERRNDPTSDEWPDALGMVLSQFADFWTNIRDLDSAQAFEKGLTASYEGSHPLYVCESQNTLGIPSALLARLFFPHAVIKQPLAGTESLVSYEKARQLIGFEPEYHLGDWLATL
jgi:NAD(P)-dependent dehydrogenase (short-subunit alcohol dehydrogenase family)